MKIILFFGLLYIVYLILAQYNNNKETKIDNSINKLYFNVSKNPYNESTNKILDLGLRFQIKGDIEKALYLYNIAYKRGDKDSLIYLGDLYYEYKNNTIKALEYYNEALKFGYYDCLLNIGDIYIYGTNNVKQNKKLAYKCYNMIINMNLSNISSKARERMNELNNEYENYIHSFSPFGEEYFIKKEKKKKDIEDTITNLTNNTLPKKNIAVKNKLYNFRIKNDRQNVHDHVVSNTVKKSIALLKEKTKINQDVASSLKNLREYLLHSKHEKVGDAITTLDQIERYNVYLSNYNMSEVDALHLVWNRINNPCNSKVKENLIGNLINELAECNETNFFTKENKQVCSTGRFTRIIDSLNCCDSENIVTIKPKFALNQEMMNKAASIRKKLLNQVGNNYVKKLLVKDKTSKDEDVHIENFYAIFKKEITDTFMKDYVNTNIISKKILKNEINKWIDMI